MKQNYIDTHGGFHDWEGDPMVMTRDEKIEDLQNKENFNHGCCICCFNSGILAGIRLRDEELLAMEFDEHKISAKNIQFIANLTEIAESSCEAHEHQKFARNLLDNILAIKGDGDV